MKTAIWIIGIVTGVIVMIKLFNYMQSKKNKAMAMEGGTTIKGIAEPLEGEISTKAVVYGCKDGTMVSNPKLCINHGGAEWVKTR